MADDPSWEPIAEVIRSELVLDPNLVIEATTPLLSSGLLDSFGLDSLVLHLERRYEITVAPAWQSPDHFETVERIVRLVSALRRGETPR
jgi:acyl carrier protein